MLPNTLEYMSEFIGKRIFVTKISRSAHQLARHGTLAPTSVLAKGKTPQPCEGSREARPCGRVRICRSLHGLAEATGAPASLVAAHGLMKGTRGLTGAPGASRDYGRPRGSPRKTLYFFPNFYSLFFPFLFFYFFIL